jgi:hypothetical protein
VPRSIKSPQSGSDPRRVRWITRYAALVRYEARTGSMPREIACPVGEAQVEERRLAGWLRYQRRRKERDVLPTWQRELLEQVPGFSWDPLGDQWDQWREQVRVFLIQERRMPKYRSTSASERALAAWVDKQRLSFRRGTLAAERVIALRSLTYKIV